MSFGVSSQATPSFVHMKLTASGLVDDVNS